ncbi:MAG: YciI family protein [Polyangiaceae bacterium]
MRIMISLQGDAPVDAISAYLAEQSVNVLGFEELADEGATITEVGDAPAVVEHVRSDLRAVWAVDVASRAAAVELAKNAPGGTATLEVRESYTEQDFGAPPDPNPPAPPPPPVRKPDTHRFIAFIRSHDEANNDRPQPESMARMDEYCAPLAANNTIIGGHGLKPSAKGTRVRRSAAQRFIFDGPFTESKELVGGYMIVQVRTLDEAIDTIRPWLRIHREGQRVSQATIEVRRLA